MPDWGATDILAGGKGTATQSSSYPDLASILAAATGGGGGGGTAQQDQATAQATGGTAAPPPPPNYHWQGGAANPGGTQAPNGQQTGGRNVDQNYQYDATGRQLTPEESAAWREYDRKRAEAGSIARSANRGGGSGANALSSGNAVYNPITQTYTLINADGTKEDGLSVADLQAKLPDNLKKEYPDWWWGQYADQQNQGRRQEIEAGAYDSQRFALMGQQSTRYLPTNF